MTQIWSREQQLTALMRMPWGVALERDSEDDSFVLQIREIPDAIGTGADEKAAAVDLWESLRESLRVRLEHGDDIPLPPGLVAPWLTDAAPPAPRPTPQRVPLLKGAEGWAPPRQILKSSGTGTSFQLTHT